jgi:uncharacterized protein (DUF2252 family)
VRNLVTPQERVARGLAARRDVPPARHAHLEVSGQRAAVPVLAAQGPSRVPELVPLRHERMVASPFAFFRGAAAVMAADLSATPASGIDVQLCGDAHLSNFGMFASPERTLLFDINDFDETHPGPWEWDLKRLVTSLVIAGRANGFSTKQTRKVVGAAVCRYRDAMAAFAAMGNLELWRSRGDEAEASRLLGADAGSPLGSKVERAAAKARTRDHQRSLRKLTEVVDGRRRLVADPPLVVPVSELAGDLDAVQLTAFVEGVLEDYAATLDAARRMVVESFTFEDLARRAGGVGSVGTRCFVVLMRGRDADDPLFLQVKEAEQSALAPYLPGRETPGNQGERVVAGQRLMQAASDPFLGWHRTTGLDGVTRDFYVRQLQDWKGSAAVETMSPKVMHAYGELCSWTLARAHARTGDRIALSTYLGGDGEHLVDALTGFAHAYADLTDTDHAAFTAAVNDGELVVASVGSP